MRINTRYVSNVAVFYLMAAVVLALSFEIWRGLLLLQLRDFAQSAPAGMVLKSFLVGWRFDFCISSYIMLPLVVLGMLPWLDISRVTLIRRLNLALMFLLTAAAFFAHLVDIEYFRNFNTRLNGGALQWQETPGLVVSMIWGMFPVVRYLLLYFVMLIFFILAIRYLLQRLHIARRKSPLIVNLLYLPLLLGLLLLGARGRIEKKAPLTWGVAYFSEYDFANQLALNPNFTFMRDVVYDAGRRDNVKRLMDQIHNPYSERIVYDLLGIADTTGIGERMHRRVTFEPETEDKANVILIILESFGTSRIGCLGSKFPYDLSPHFDSLAQQGVLFSNFYSSGYHTFSGVFSTLYGSPISLGLNLLKDMAGQSRYRGLPGILQERGYYTVFFCPHDPHFDNLQGFLMSNGMMKVYSLRDYESECGFYTWGVPDHVMFDNALARLRNEVPRPFFATLLAVSHHGPWFIPDVDFERVPDDVKHSEELNSFKYSDWSLGRFVGAIMADSAFRNTIIVITSDNGYLYKPQLDLDISLFHAPLLILHSDSARRVSRRLDIVGGQLDVVATVMGRLRLSYDDYSFGHDLLDGSRPGVDFAHFSEWYNIGYVESDYFVVVRTQGKTSLFRLGDLKTNLAEALPELTQDYAAKALAIYEAAYLNMKRPLPHANPGPPRADVPDNVQLPGAATLTAGKQQK